MKRNDLENALGTQLFVFHHKQDHGSVSVMIGLLPFTVAGCGSKGIVSTGPTNPPVPTTQHILFVGDSFTHGRYLPVRTYNNTRTTGGAGSTVASNLVVDENFNTKVTAREENEPGEAGPWGGIPGIFAQLAHETGLPYDVHIEAISATTLASNYDAAQSVIDQPLWNAVVLQEASFEPITNALSYNSNSDPAAFCNAVENIEQGIHVAAPAANVYLYETWAPADTGYIDATKNSTAAFVASTYTSDLDTLTAAYHDVYISAANQDGHIGGIAPVGDAWALAWSQGVANSNPYDTSGTGPYLTFNYQAGSQPSTVNKPTDAGFHHPSIYGAYLSGLVLFEKITGTDVRTLGGTEQAAASLGISSAITLQLEQVAWQSVTQQNNQLFNPNNNLCSLTH
jgi:hypothetical protein